ncbi:MAG TPA: gluconate 2-dehydrogenase subunit 3 family protein [Bryobacteraceae bacterium]|nr:gluconate 2-dehydrogenase subunit 3 family protein [Bryobacteraceae bacterium]
MEDTSRRDLFKIIGSSIVLTTAGSGVLSPALAQHVHAAMADARSLSGGAAYLPKAFTKHDFQTLKKLADIVIPTDQNSPGASEAGAAEYIDFLASRNADLAAIFNGGFAWLDNYMSKTYGADFLTAKPQQQTDLLDKLAYKKNHTPQTAPGVPFWTWVRNMTVDAYYTSPAGVKDIGYMGNGAMSSFSVPKEAVDYALKRSPFANEG